jgi:dipeptidyl aminopeptidase/acylaminoacyl peptidase
MSKKSAPYGTWDSPITAEAIVANSIGIDDVLVDPVTSTVYHNERRSTGSNAIVNTSTGIDVVAGDWNVRTGVQEYGGGAAIAYDGNIYFSNIKDGRVYMVKEGEVPQPVTPESTVHRFANFAVHPKCPTLLVSILEDYTEDSPQAVKTTLCVIDTKTKCAIELQGISKADFFAAPVFSPDGKRLAWQQWYHPDMPWEGAELYVADVILSESKSKTTGFVVANAKHIAGQANDISAGYPSWANDSTLIFTSDISGYQNPWKYSTTSDVAQPVFPTAVTEDFSPPAWNLGGSPYALLDDTGVTALFSAFRGGRSVLYLVDLRGGAQPQEVFPSPFAIVRDLRQVAAGKLEVVFCASKSDGPGGVVRCTLSLSSATATATYTIIKSTESPNSASAKFPAGIISLPRPMTFEVPPEGDPLHVVFYAPTNPDYEGSSVDEEKPPCVVNVHGGPTGMEGQALSWTKQYFTSRGWAWLDVNYGGSSGYGRKYTGLLAGKWGIKDIQDSLQASKALSDDIDPTRIVIRGGSAGGYTVLAAVSFGPEHTFYAAATSSYGISNLRLLAQFTHKFELRYMEKLMGGTIEEIPDVYDKERSPLFHADKIETPLLILQGSEDKVVPPQQAEAIVKSIEARGGNVKYVLFPGEGHGFRKAENIKKALESEIGWYENVLGLTRKK